MYQDNQNLGILHQPSHRLKIIPMLVTITYMVKNTVVQNVRLMVMLWRPKRSAKSQLSFVQAAAGIPCKGSSGIYGTEHPSPKAHTQESGSIFSWDKLELTSLGTEWSFRGQKYILISLSVRCTAYLWWGSASLWLDKIESHHPPPLSLNVSPKLAGSENWTPQPSFPVSDAAQFVPVDRLEYCEKEERRQTSLAQTQSYNATTSCDSLTGELINKRVCRVNVPLDPVCRDAMFGVILFTPSRISISPCST